MRLLNISKSKAELLFTIFALLLIVFVCSFASPISRDYQTFVQYNYCSKKNQQEESNFDCVKISQQGMF